MRSGSPKRVDQLKLKWSAGDCLVKACLWLEVRVWLGPLDGEKVRWALDRGGV